MPYRRHQGPGINNTNVFVNGLNKQLQHWCTQPGQKDAPRLVIYDYVPQRGSVAKHVYKGKFDGEEGLVAIKEYDKNKFSAQQLNTIQGEIKHLDKLRHPWITTYRGQLEPSDDTWLVVLEWFEGLPLYARLQELGTPDPLTYLSIINKVLVAAHHANQKKVIHRDIKPDNIFVSESLDVRLMDFGMACAVNHAASKTTGCDRYRASIHTGNTVDEYADIFPLGLIIYEMFTNQFKKRSLSDKLGEFRENALTRLTSGEPLNFPKLEREFLDRVQAEVQAKDFFTAKSAFETIVRKALAPEKSYHTVEALRLDLHMAINPPDLKQLEDLLKDAELQPKVLQQIFGCYQSIFRGQPESLPALPDSVILENTTNIFKERRHEITRKLLAYCVQQIESPYQPKKEQLKAALLKELNGSFKYEDLLATARTLDPAFDPSKDWLPTIRTCSKLWDIFEENGKR